MPYQMPEISSNGTLHDQLCESEEKYLRLTNLMPIGVFSTDASGVITFYNEKAVEIWGRRPRINDPGEIRYCGSWKMFNPDGTVLLHENCPMGQVLKTAQSIRNKEITIERPDGTRSLALVNIDPIVSPDGKILGAINVFQDISQRKKDEAASLRLAAIITSSEDAIISKTLDGIIRSWNKGAEKLFGYTEDEIIGKHITTLIPPSKIEDERIIISRIAAGKLVDHFETIRIDKYGNEIPISLTVSPIKDEKGNIVGASKIARNISGQVEIQKQLQDYNEKLEKLNNYKDEFIGMASHELKTPLTSIKANLQVPRKKVV